MKITTTLRSCGVTVLAALVVLAAGCAHRQASPPAPSDPVADNVPYVHQGSTGRSVAPDPDFVHTGSPEAKPLPAVTAPSPKVEPTPVRPLATTSSDSRFRTSTAAFPTGNRQTSALLVEKTVPIEVLVGQPFDIVYKVTNLTDLVLQDVTLTDDTANNFRAEQSTPKADRTGPGGATWVIGELAPRQSKEIRVRGTALAEGFITGCGTATFRPTVCETIKVVKPAIQLAKTMPAQVIQCDPIPVKLTVKNNGSSELTNVRVTDSLPAGLLTDAGQSSATFDAGTLAPGQSKDFAFNAKAARTGKFLNPAKATSAQGVEAVADASVTVVKPVLSVVCAVPAEKEIAGTRFTEFIGRPFQVCWEVKNSGDAAAADSVLTVAVPAGLTFSSGTDGGSASGANVSWNLGSLAPGASKRVCGTFSGPSAGSYAFNASTRGVCAEPASTSCSVIIQGINAILVEVVDDPDPIQVGELTTYTIKVTNQGGGIDLRDLVVKAFFPAELDPVNASNNAQVTGKSVVWPTVASVPLKQTVTYTVRGKANAAGDARLKVEVTTRARQVPITEVESTTTY